MDLITFPLDIILDTSEISSNSMDKTLIKTALNSLKSQVFTFNSQLNIDYEFNIKDEVASKDDSGYFFKFIKDDKIEKPLIQAFPERKFIVSLTTDQKMENQISSILIVFFSQELLSIRDIILEKDKVILYKVFSTF